VFCGGVHESARIQDTVNRKVVIKMLIDVATVSGRQFFFLSPLDISEYVLCCLRMYLLRLFACPAAS
jgi:hypothetical protein